MKSVFQYSNRPKCPRCRSGNISEADELTLEKEKLAKWKEITDREMARWECRTCDYKWVDLSAGFL
jgi:predicted nucleic-acid-binding Zn-ribbon protein